MDDMTNLKRKWIFFNCLIHHWGRGSRRWFDWWFAFFQTEDRGGIQYSRVMQHILIGKPEVCWSCIDINREHNTDSHQTQRNKADTIKRTSQGQDHHRTGDIFINMVVTKTFDDLDLSNLIYHHWFF